jgi:hypothetical protein
MLLSTYRAFDFTKYKVQDNVYNVPEIPVKLEAYLNEKSSFLVLTGFEMVSPLLLHLSSRSLRYLCLDD